MRDPDYNYHKSYCHGTVQEESQAVCFFFLIIPEFPSCCCFEQKRAAVPAPYCQEKHPLLWICSWKRVFSSFLETDVRGRKQLLVLMIGNFCCCCCFGQDSELRKWTKKKVYACSLKEAWTVQWCWCSHGGRCTRLAAMLDPHWSSWTKGAGSSGALLVVSAWHPIVWRYRVFMLRESGYLIVPW